MLPVPTTQVCEIRAGVPKVTSIGTTGDTQTGTQAAPCVDNWKQNNVFSTKEQTVNFVPDHINLAHI